jgi:hypothetical protein
VPTLISAPVVLVGHGRIGRKGRSQSQATADRRTSVRSQLFTEKLDNVDGVGLGSCSPQVRAAVIVGSARSRLVIVKSAGWAPSTSTVSRASGGGTFITKPQERHGECCKGACESRPIATWERGLTAGTSFDRRRLCARRTGSRTSLVIARERRTRSKKGVVYPWICPSPPAEEEKTTVRISQPRGFKLSARARAAGSKFEMRSYRHC